MQSASQGLRGFRASARGGYWRANSGGPMISAVADCLSLKYGVETGPEFAKSLCGDYITMFSLVSVRSSTANSVPCKHPSNTYFKIVQASTGWSFILVSLQRQHDNQKSGFGRTCSEPKGLSAILLYNK